MSHPPGSPFGTPAERPAPPSRRTSPAQPTPPAPATRVASAPTPPPGPAPTPPPQPRIAVILRHGLNPDGWAARYAAGETWDRTPYGYDLATDHADLRWSRDHAEGWVLGLVRSVIRRGLGFDLVHVWRNRALLDWADAVWTHTEREHLAVALLNATRPRRRPTVSIAQSVWLWDSWPSFGPLRRAFYTRLLRQHDVELTLSSTNRDVSAATVTGRRVVFIPFGTQGIPEQPTTTSHDGAPSSPVALAVGNDRHRDWVLLAAVARDLPDVRFDVVSLSQEARRVDWPSNAHVRAADSVAELAAAYSASDVVVLPLGHNLHASGCTVAIEAITSGTPLVVSDAGGIATYVEGSAAELVEIGDVTGFTAAVRRVLADPASHRPPADHQAVHGLTPRDYVERVLRVTRAVLAHETIPPGVSSPVRQELT